MRQVQKLEPSTAPRDRQAACPIAARLGRPRASGEQSSVEGYKIQFASSVGYRDGVQLELLGPDGEYVAEVFRDDVTGHRAFNSLTENLSVPLPVLTWFLAAAETELAK